MHKKKFLVSRETVLAGSLNAPVGGRVDGTVNGDVKITGDLLISKTAHIRGEVTAENIEIYGQVYGNITCASKATVYNKAYIKGNINALVIEVKEGAVIEGFIVKHALPGTELENRPAIAEEPIDMPTEVVDIVAVPEPVKEPEKSNNPDQDATSWF